MFLSSVQLDENSGNGMFSQFTHSKVPINHIIIHNDNDDHGAQVTLCGSINAIFLSEYIHFVLHSSWLYCKGMN